MERKKKNIKSVVPRKRGEKLSSIEGKQKNVKDNTAGSNTKLIADSIWAFGLKNGFKNSNRLIWVASNKTKSNDNHTNNPRFNNTTFHRNNIHNVEQPKSGQETSKNTTHQNIIRKKGNRLGTQKNFLFFRNEHPEKNKTQSKNGNSPFGIEFSIRSKVESGVLIVILNFLSITVILHIQTIFDKTKMQTVEM